MSELYKTDNLIRLAGLLIKTWRHQALGRAKALAGRNHHAPEFIDTVWRLLECAS